MNHAQVNGIGIEYEAIGEGHAVLFVHGALVADGLRLLTHEPALGRFRRIRYHRRGLGGSTRPVGATPTTVTEQAEDARALLDHLGVDRAHVVGHSLGGVIALELAARHPGRVSSLALLEPGPLPTPAAAEFVPAVAALAERYAAGDAVGAVDGFFGLLGDAGWRETIERAAPGAIAQAVKDAPSLFESELLGVPAWTFGPERAAAIDCPVLSVFGTRSPGLFVESRELLHRWFPRCRDADVVDATHLLPAEAPSAVAEAISSFV
jgi:pimeloyl-ACP methyl ester carboxylesterase